MRPVLTRVGRIGYKTYPTRCTTETILMSEPKMASSKPSEDMKAFISELRSTVDRHREKLPGQHLLAGLAHVTGMLVALQDQRVMTPDIAMKVVQANMVEGHKTALKRVMSAGGAKN